MVVHRIVLAASAFLLLAAIGSLAACSSDPSPAAMVATLAVKDCEEIGYPKGHPQHFDCLAVTMPARVNALPNSTFVLVPSRPVGSGPEGSSTGSRQRVPQASFPTVQRGYTGVTGMRGSADGWTLD